MTSVLQENIHSVAISTHKHVKAEGPQERTAAVAEAVAGSHARVAKRNQLHMNNRKQPSVNKTRKKRTFLMNSVASEDQQEDLCIVT